MANGLSDLLLRGAVGLLRNRRVDCLVSSNCQIRCLVTNSTSLEKLAEKCWIFRDLTEEDVNAMRVESIRIMSDPIAIINPDESEVFRVPIPKSDRTPFQDIIWKVHGRHREYKRSAVRLIHLIMERLENEPLTRAFHIDGSFNHRAYFFVLHVWLLHRRLRVERYEGELTDDALFDFTWHIFKEWLLLKGVPEFRFFAELKHCQEYMFGLCFSLDFALQRVDILPSRIREALWANVWAGNVDPDEPHLDLMTKYVVRQLTHILHIDRDSLLSSNFVWADFSVTPDMPRQKVVPALTYVSRYAGYRPTYGSVNEVTE